MLGCLVAIAVAAAVASFVVRPNAARSFELFYGSMFINDNTSPVAVDLASGKPAVRLSNAFKAVGARRTGDLDVVPLTGGTLMLDSTTGEFNIVDASGFVVKASGGGVVLPLLPGATSATAVASADSAYIVQHAAERSAVYLVGQSTVASAIGVGAHAKARAYRAIAQPVLATPGGRTSAAGDLWLLSGRGTTHAVTQLSVPPGSNAGATLAATRRGTIGGVAALMTATRNADGSGGDVVALASNKGLALYSATNRGDPQRLSIAPPDGLRQILPVTNAQGSAAFLYRTRAGWSLVSARADGTGRASVHPISQIAAGLDLVPPAQSGGRLYTAAHNGSGALWQIDGHGDAATIPGAGSYPLLPQETLDTGGIEVLARGSRVMFNARGDFEALVVFTDGSQQPRVLDKHSAVQVDASGAAALSVGSPAGRARRGKAARPKPAPALPKASPRQTINEKVSCTTTTQQPHIPLVQLLQRGSRSVQLRWSYPLLDPQDCAPSTYTVSARLLDGGNAPPAPAPITVQGQDGVNLTQLFPDTKYEIVVTAYLNGTGTPSVPLIVRTSVAGPDAPTSVKASADSTGNWTLTWNSCGGVQTGCIPTANWQIIATFCDGAGLSKPPASAQLAGDPTQHSFSFTYPGNDTLLGRGLAFQVTGTGAQGTIGTPSAGTACTRSWTPPVAADITVQASDPPVAAGGSTTQTTVSVLFRAGQRHDLGGAGGQLRYELRSGNAVVATRGPISDASVTIGGIQPGRRYQVLVIASAPGHPSASVQIGPVDVRPALAQWPVPSVSASFHDDATATGTLAVHVGFPSGTDTFGESFDLVDSTLSCGGGNVVLDLTRTGFVPGELLSFSGISREIYHGAVCRVDVQLAQNSAHLTDPPLYGAGFSARAGTTVPIDAPTFAGSGADFSAGWLSSDLQAPTIAVSYHGHDPLLLAHADSWRTQLRNATTPDCGSASVAPPVTLDVVRDCAKQGGAFSATISFSYFGVNQTFDVPVRGSAPVPVDYKKIGFTASWKNRSSASAGGSVVVHYADHGAYDQAVLDGLHWTFTVNSDASPGVSCASSAAAPQTGGAGPVLDVDFAACPSGGLPGPPPTPAANYTLTVHVEDPIFGSMDWSTPVIGTLQP